MATYKSLKEYPAIQYDGNNAEQVVNWAKNLRYTGYFGHDYYAQRYKDYVKKIHDNPDPATHGLLVYDKDLTAHGLAVIESGGTSFPKPGDWIVFDETLPNTVFKVFSDEDFHLCFENNKS